MTRPQPFTYWAVVEENGQWTAKCRCGWKQIRDNKVSARTACMYHYYVCPKRWEAFTDDDASGPRLTPSPSPSDTSISWEGASCCPSGSQPSETSASRGAVVVGASVADDADPVEGLRSEEGTDAS